MARKKLQAALQSGGGAVANVIPRHEKLTDEQMRIAAFEARDNQDASITDKMANDNRRNTLLAEMGFDWFDIQDIQPNPNNSYTITDEGGQKVLKILNSTRFWELSNYLVVKVG